MILDLTAFMTKKQCNFFWASFRNSSSAVDKRYRTETVYILETLDCQLTQSEIISFGSQQLLA